MKVLVTGVYGRVGTAIIDYLHDHEEYEFTYYNRTDRPPEHRYGNYDTIVGNVIDHDTLMDTAADHDAMIHLAAYPLTDGTWDDIHKPNIVGMYNALEAAKAAKMDTFVFGSSNHVLGMYEEENSPEIYYPGHGFALDRHSEVRPDSYYGMSKVYGENIARQYSEVYGYPKHVYSLRICSVRHREYDHPWGDAERLAEQGEFERGSQEYKETIARMKGMWQSRRDFAHQVECCLDDKSVKYGIYSGVSANDRRWYSVEYARSELGYSPQDNGDDWDEMPEWSGDPDAAPVR